MTNQNSKIIIYPNPILRKKTAMVENIIDPEIQNVIKKMKIAIKEAGGVGLAANQIGEKVSIFLVSLEDKTQTFINPEIVKKSKNTKSEKESCLSLPGIFGIVTRTEKIVITARNEKGKKIKKSAKGLLARIFQHEIDHLNGILFIDKAKEIHEIPSTNPPAGGPNNIQ